MSVKFTEEDSFYHPDEPGSLSRVLQSSSSYILVVDGTTTTGYKDALISR